MKILPTLFVVTLLLLTGCGEAKPGAGERRPAEQQELVVGAGADDFGLEMNRHRLGMYPLNANICEPLVRLTPDFRVEPWLATRWEYRGDNTFRFTLRPGVRFHDGRPFDATAVKFSLDRAARTGIGHSFLSEESVRIVDDTTVDIRPARPNLRLVEQLVHSSYSMVAPGSDPAVHPVCTGPFRFVEYLRANRLTVERNDQYWGEKARLRKLTFRFIPDENTRALA
nr:ABC transporter substrate-binding protein [Gemmatimonadota bacterium]